MYCSTCGVAVPQGLSYCNYCGAKLNAVQGDNAIKPSEVRAELLICAMTGMFILGTAAITVLMGVMKAVLDLPVDRVLGFAMLPFLVMLLLEGVFLRLLLRRTRGAEGTGNRAISGEQTTKELDAAPARALPENRTSVTEHTTRSFEPVYRERTSK